MDIKQESQSPNRSEVSERKNCFWTDLRFDRRLWDTKDATEHRRVVSDEHISKLKDYFASKWQLINQSLANNWCQRHQSGKIDGESEPRKNVLEDGIMKDVFIDSSLKAMAGPIKLSLLQL